MDAQTIGSNAVLTINGAKYTSLSNNVTSDSTGITGLTINLKGLTSGSAVTLTVKRDTESLVNAITNILDRYNELIANIDTAVAKDGKLKDQSMLKLIRNSIRSVMNSADPGSTRFRNLASIGIKASAESNANSISTDNNDITFLSLDKETFMNAFENYEEDVKALLIGSTDANGNVINKGILTRVEEIVEGAIQGASGYFTTANKSFTTELDNISKKIVNGTQAIEKYRKRLENKFSSMDIMIAGLQNQYSSFLAT
jgi:flagellar hook-associated protein 2